MSYAVPARRGGPPPLPAVPRSRSRGGHRGDTVFRVTLTIFGLAVIVLVAGIAVMLAGAAMPSIRRFGLAFLWTSRWDPVHNVFGALPFVFGTIASSALALLIAVPISLGVAIYLVEIAPSQTALALSFLVELLAAIPSVILGLWGIFVLAPWVRSAVEPVLAATLGWLPLFGGPQYGIGLLAAGIILAVMIIPIVSAVSRDILRAVPPEQREAMYALGATRWEVISRAVLPYGRVGIIGAVILGLGRALGETMAVTMVIGNRPQIATSLFQPAYTIAAVLANEFTEATSDLYLSALIEMALVLFVVSLIVNAMARWLVARVTSKVPVGL
ncbi:MAG TPA: phosphate ABC transporter permease subunit PstC [bacterium]|nr:phosphate ABC transporter permease subunit PstC [bacterium]